MAEMGIQYQERFLVAAECKKLEGASRGWRYLEAQA
jgi:hypothetical protein